MEPEQDDDRCDGDAGEDDPDHLDDHPDHHEAGLAVVDAMEEHVARGKKKERNFFLHPFQYFSLPKRMFVKKSAYIM